MWRLAIQDEDHHLIKMCEDLNREDPGPRPVPSENMIRTLEILRADPVRGRAIVLEMDRKVVGYALLISFWSNELGGEVCTIDELYVEPNYRGKGYSKALIKAIRERDAIWPNKSVAIELEVTPQNLRAMTLYLSLGFEPVKNSHMRLPR